MQTCPYPLHLMFDNLTHLELTLDIDHERLGVGSFKWTWLNILLSHLPKLQTLIMDEVFNVMSFLFHSTSMYFFIYFKTFQLCIIVRLIQ